MNIITGYTKTETAGKSFYPTPEDLVNKMLNRVEWEKVFDMLEPSAGKGDIAVRMIERWKVYNSSPYNTSPEADIDCIEIDPNLRAILKSQGLRVVHDDFMTYNTMKRYSLIVMNPDFSTAAKHILKAISLLAPEGQLVALCNAETIKNPCTNERDLLLRTLGDAQIEYITGAFQKAERKTDVETAMIVYKAPAEEEKSFILENLRPAHKYVEMTQEETADLTKSDFVEAIIDRYNYEVESGIHLIREYKAVSHMLNSDYSGNANASMALVMENNKIATEDKWIRSVRYKYWNLLFAHPQLIEQFTTNIREAFYHRLHELQDYEFSYFNIKEILIQMNAHVSEGVEKTILNLFDDWTRKYHWDENAKNRHYFDGWKTNDAFAVNKRVVLPLSAYNYWSYNQSHEFRAYNVNNRIEDIEKVFNYLDGGRTEDGEKLRDILERCETTGEAKDVDTKYFRITFYKKGTAHLVFKNEELLAKFNIFAARGKNWLPPSFGRKHYKDMDEEEKKVIDSFMDETGGKKYEKIMAQADYYLNTGSSLLNLTA